MEADVATSAPMGGNFLAKFTWNGVTGQRGAKTAGTQVFPEYEAGTYAIVYETKDQHFTSKACRQIENVDHTHPIIQILGSDHDARGHPPGQLHRRWRHVLRP